MNKARMEAFSDGVIAIIITIMVLDFKLPHGDDIKSLEPLVPVFISYVLSFVYVGIYWNNHHHMMQAASSVNGTILWLNMHLLFWMSLVPFVTSWMGEHHFAKWPVTCYGVILIMNAFAYTLLTTALIKHHGKDSLLAQAIGKDWKGKLSLVIYFVAIIAASFIDPHIGFSLYIVVACIWFIPDKRIEKRIAGSAPSAHPD